MVELWVIQSINGFNWFRVIFLKVESNTYTTSNTKEAVNTLHRLVHQKYLQLNIEGKTISKLSRPGLTGDLATTTHIGVRKLHQR